MNKAQDEAKQLNKDIHDKQKKEFKEGMKHWAIVEIVRGIWLFAEGSALIITSLYAIRQGHYANLPEWGGYTLTVAGVLVLVPAAMLLTKFFRGAAKA